MGEIQPCPGESDGGDQAQRLGQRPWSLGSGALEGGSQVGQIRQASRRPLPLPQGSGISGVRDEGQPHPLLPSGSGIPPAGVGG